MSPTPSHNGKPTPKTNTTATKPEALEPSAAPTTQAADAPTPKKEEAEPTRPYTITVPTRVLKLISIISKTEGVSASDIWLDAIEKSGLKDRARAALASLANDLGE